MDDEMIERCAWAIMQSMHWRIEGGKPMAWSDLDPSQEKLIKHATVECIKAMREPTDKMKIAGSIDPGSGGPDEGYETEIWQAMLDAIIGDE